MSGLHLYLEIKILCWSSMLVLLVSGVLSVEPIPKFDQTPLNVTVIAGNTAILPCTIEDRGNHQVIWMNPNLILISTEDRRVIDDQRMSIERPFVSDWNLHIREVRLSDGGEYTCQINTDPIQIKRLYLYVQMPATIHNSSSSSDMVVREGTTVELTCNASGIPEPTVTWYRKTSKTQQAKEHIGTKGQVLLIHNISRYCGGMYECKADNQITDPAVRQIKVDVAFPPEVTLRTHRLGQYRGKETILECIVTGYPHEVNQWVKDGKSFDYMESWKYRTDIYKEDHLTATLYLRIINLDEYDFGIYTCEASNSLGKSHADFELYEYRDPTTQPRPTTTPTTTTRWIPPNRNYEDRYPSDQAYTNEKNGIYRSTPANNFRKSHTNNGQVTGYYGVGNLYGGTNSRLLLSSSHILCFLMSLLTAVFSYISIS